MIGRAGRESSNWRARCGVCHGRAVILASGLSLVAVVASGLAAADPGPRVRPVQVEFDAPAGCSDAAAFFSSLRSRTDQVRPAADGEPHTTLQVRLSRARGHVLGELRVVDERGGTDTRKVQGANCGDVVQALSLTAALAIDPSALLSAPATTSVPEPASAAPPTLAPTPAPSTELPGTEALQTAESLSSRAATPIPSVEIGAGLVGAALLSTTFSTGVAFFARKILAGNGAFRPTLGIAIAHIRNDVLLSPGIVRVSLTDLAGTVCPLRWSASVVTFQPCVLAVAGWLAASGSQVTHSNSVDRLWLSAGGVLRAAAFLGHGLSLELEAGISALFFKRRFFTTIPSNVVAETPAISPIVGLGLTYGMLAGRSGVIPF